MSVPSNLIPTRISQLPVATTPQLTDTTLIVQGGVTKRTSLGDMTAIVTVPPTRSINTGTGLAGGGNLTADRTLYIDATGVTAGTYGSSTLVPILTINAQGQVTSASTTAFSVAFADITSKPTTLAGYGITDAQPLNNNLTALAGVGVTGLLVRIDGTTAFARTITGGTGIDVTDGDGVLGNPTIALNSTGVTPGTFGSATETPVLTIDAQGRITTSGVITILPDWTSIQNTPTTLAGYGITDAVPNTRTVTGTKSISGGGALNANLSFELVNDVNSPGNLYYYGTNNAGSKGWFAFSTIGGGTVTSVGLAMPSIFTVTNSPVTTSGTLTADLNTQNANLVFAGPYSGSAAVPTFRSLGNDDLPIVLATKGGTGQSSYTVGDLLYADTSTTLAKLADVATGNVLLSGGVGVAPSWGKVDVTAAITGIVPIANGGTGQSTASAAFDALSPLTTRGDLIYRNATTNTRLAVGSANYALLSNGTDPVWGQVSLSAGVTGTLPIANGGTGATTAATARSNLGAAASGANADITSMTGITGGISTPDFIQFDAAATVTDATAKLYYDNNDQFKTLSFQMNGSSIQRIGEETYYRVKLTAPATRGQVMMFTGTLGASGGLQAAPATGLTPDQANYILGIADETGTTNDWIFVKEFGEVKQINTTGGAEAWVQGQVLYYNPSVTGGLTKTKPTTPNAIAVMASVVHVGTSNGILFVRPTFGSVLGGTDGNVEFTSLTNGDIIFYDGVQQRWENAAQSTLAVGSATNIAGGTANQIPYQTGAGATSFIVAPTVSNTYLNWSGSAFQWSSNPLGTVTSVDVSGGTTGLSFSGGPITTSGTITMAGTLAAVNGGTGITGYVVGDLLFANTTTTLDRLAAGSAGYPLLSNGAGTSPGYNQLNLATAVTGTLPIANGGTGQTTASAAFDALAPTTTRGDLIYRNATSNTRLAVGTANYALTSNGTDPVWAQISLTAGVTGTLPTANGGTGLTTFTAANNAIYSTSSSALTAGTLPVLAGGTGGTTIAQAQANLQVDPAGTALALAMILG